MGGDRAFPGARRPGNQDAAAPKQALAAEHGVQRGDAGGHPFGRRLVVERQGGDGHHREAGLVNQERILVGAMGRSAILDDPQPPRRHLVDHPMVEQDDAVRHIFLQPVTRQHAASSLGRHDRRDATVLQPPEESAQFGAEDRLVRQGGEQGFDRIEHDALRLDPVDRMAQADEQPFEIVIAGLVDFAVLGPHEFDCETLPLDELVHVEPKGRDILQKLPLLFFERDEESRLMELHCAAEQELHAEECLAAAGPAGHQRRAPLRQAAAGDFVQPTNAGRRFGEMGQRQPVRLSNTRHGKSLPSAWRISQLRGHRGSIWSISCR